MARTEEEYGMIVSTKYIGGAMFYDGPKRVAFRMGHPARNKGPKRNTTVQTELHWMREIQAVQDLHIQRYREYVNGQNRKRRDIRFGMMLYERALLDIVENELRRPPTGLFVVGLILTVLLMVIQINFRRGQDSRFMISLIGLAMVMLSLFTSLGLLVRCEIKFNSVIVTALPFLLVGLGLDDMFVIVGAFGNLG
jgi:hypothetical protein